MGQGAEKRSEAGVVGKFTKHFTLAFGADSVPPPASTLSNRSSVVKLFFNKGIPRSFTTKRVRDRGSNCCLNASTVAPTQRARRAARTRNQLALTERDAAEEAAGLWRSRCPAGLQDLAVGRTGDMSAIHAFFELWAMRMKVGHCLTWRREKVVRRCTRRARRKSSANVDLLVSHHD